MGRAGRLRKPELHRSHKELNRALHELHKGAGLPSLATVATELKGAGISRSTIYDAFSSTRLPNWHVVDALVEVLATRHPRTAPEQQVETFHALWLLAVDEEDDGAGHDLRNAPEEPQDDTGDRLTVRLTGGKSTIVKSVSDIDILASTGASALVSSMTAEAWPRMREQVSAIFHRRYEGRIWLHVPYELKDRAKEFGARWDADYKLWFIEKPVPELMEYQVPGPHPPEIQLGDTNKG